MIMIPRLIAVMCLGLIASTAAYAQNKEQKRLENSRGCDAGNYGHPDNIPQSVMDKSKCVIVFPSVLKAAFVVGASYGRGAMVCRTGQIFEGLGARQQCTRWRAAALDFKSADKLPILFC